MVGNCCDSLELSLSMITIILPEWVVWFLVFWAGLAIIHLVMQMILLVLNRMTVKMLTQEKRHYEKSDAEDKKQKSKPVNKSKPPIRKDLN